MDALTVEPGEPAESGSRTAWIAWQPPADGRFTWRILRAGFFSTVGEAPPQQSVFEGDTLDALELVAHDEGDETMDQVIAFDVRADATYRLALGLPRDAAEVPLGDQTFILEWGETPSNDDVANAMMVASSGGTYSGSNAFATTEKGEMTGTLGDSSLWWALEPDETGWMRFAAEGLDGLKLAVYRRGQDGTLQLVRSGRSLGSTASVSFLAEAGVRYLVRLGAYYWDQDGYGGDTLGDFELSWSPADPPAMLRYAGSVATGDLAEDGTVVELGELGAQAFNTDGTELYVVSRLGIVVFARDVPTGELTLRQTLPDYSVFDDDARLLWDARGDALLVATCDAWWRFTPRQGGNDPPDSAQLRSLLVSGRAGHLDGIEVAVDIACGFHGDLYTIQVGRDGMPFASDHVRADGSNNDSFGNPVPFYIRLGSIVRSPDDRHLYLARLRLRPTRHVPLRLET
ncbi:MAG: hypothetical protein OXU77_00480, partial [Gammaproteobacteria bacterium]|nr:hypothetical protein [Gammaproteobacteria bacterium]